MRRMVTQSTDSDAPRLRARDESGGEFALGRLAAALAFVVRSGRRGILYVLSSVALAVLIAVLLPNRYTSSAEFIAQQSDQGTLPTSLEGLAATVGLNVGNTYSPQFYADLLTSRPVLLTALEGRYRVPAGDSVRMASYFEIEHLEDPSRAVAIEAGLKDLAKRVSARADARTNIISVSVEAKYPELSRDMLARLLEALDSLNIHFQQEQSRDLRRFYEERVVASQQELDSAELTLRHFLEKNRRTDNSPLLQFELARLQRIVDIKKAVYTTIIQQYEQARLQEARNVPTLTVLAHPFVPVKKTWPPRKLIAVLGALFGLALIWLERKVGEIGGRLGTEHPDVWQIIRASTARVRHPIRKRG